MTDHSSYSLVSLVLIAAMKRFLIVIVLEERIRDHPRVLTTALLSNRKQDIASDEQLF